MARTSAADGAVTALTELIGSTAEIAGAFGCTAQEAELSGLVESIQSTRFRIAVVGRMKTGKSTLIDSLIGHDVLPNSSVPTSAIPVAVHWAEKPQFHLVGRSTAGSKRAELVPVTLDRFQSEVVIKKGRPVRYERAEVGWPSEVLRHGVELMDTPGLDEAEEREAITMSAIRSADAVIMVMDARQSFAMMSERPFIEFCRARHGHRDLFLVFNYLNMVHDTDDVVERDLELSEAYTTDIEHRVFHVAAGPALAARSGEAPAGTLAGTGIPELEAAITDMAKNQAARIKLGRAARRLDWIRRELMRILVERAASGERLAEACAGFAGLDTLGTALAKFCGKMGDPLDVDDADRTVSLTRLGLVRAAGAEPRSAGLDHRDVASDLRSLEEHLRSHPTDADAWAECAAAHIVLGEETKALAAVEAALRDHPNDGWLLALRGRSLLGLDRNAEAVDPLRSAVRRGPRRPWIHCSLGEALIRTGRAAEAVKAFDAALAVDRRFDPALLGRGLALLQADKVKEAVTTLKKAVSAAPDNPQALGWLAEALRISGKPEEAVAYLERSLALEPDQAWMLGTLGQALRGCGRHHEAAKALTRALELDPTLGWVEAEIAAAAADFEPAGRIDIGAPVAQVVPGHDRVAVATADGDIEMWRISDRIQLWERFCGAVSRSPATSVAVSTDEPRVVTGCASASVELWSADDGAHQGYIGEQFRFFARDRGFDVTGVALSPDGRRLAIAQGNGKLTLWNLGTQQREWQVQAHPAGTCRVAFRPDGTGVATGSDTEAVVKEWRVAKDASDDTVVFEQYSHTDASAVLTLAYAADTSMLAVGTDVGASLWQPPKGRRKSSHLRSLDSAGEPVTAIAFGRSNKVLAGGDQFGIIRLWNPVDGAVLVDHQEHEAKITSLAFTPDGDVLVSAAGAIVSFRRFAGTATVG